MDPRFAEQYGDYQRWHWWFRGRERILADVLRRAVGGRTSLTIAALGSGPAEGQAWLLPLAGPRGRVVAVDVDPLHGERLGGRLEYLIARLEALPLRAGSFDVVLALDVLEHLDDDDAGLHEAARLLRAGGVLVVTVPALPSLWGPQDVVNHHRRRYTKRAFRALFARSRLPPPRITFFNTLLFPPIAAVRWGRRLLGAPEEARSDLEGSRPGVVNAVLTAVFAFERHLLPRVSLPIGASLLAVVGPDAGAR
jgi:SAM-dependent methyltransferase